MMRYINPFTDFGFKKLFGDEANKDILIDFLNELLREEQSEIIDLTFIKNEQLGDQALDRKAIFDVYCETTKGETFIVELQKAKQNFFKDRSVYYATFPIREQAIKENWNYKLEPVYTIAILDFVFDEDKNEPDKLLYKIKLTDIETQKVFYDKLTFVYLEMPKFTKTIDELESHFDRWLYVIRNLALLDEYPEQLQEKIFKKFFRVAEIAQLSPTMQDDYRRSLKYYWDLNNVMDTAREEAFSDGMQKGIERGIQQGIEQGIEQGLRKKAVETAHKLRQMQLSLEQIAATTDLSVEELRQIFQHV